MAIYFTWIVKWKTKKDDICVRTTDVQGDRKIFINSVSVKL